MFDLNRHNQDFYLENGTNGVPDLLAMARPIQEAIRLEVESRILHDPIRVMELGFGSRPHRYVHIGGSTTRTWRVCLTDFSVDVLPALTELPTFSAIEFSRQSLNLLDGEFPDGQFDAIVSTYVFDSIEFPDDRFEHGKHFPGGMIETVKRCIEKLTPGGIFLTIDAWASHKGVEYRAAGGAQFKSLDLDAAAQALVAMYGEERVMLLSLNDFLARHNQLMPLNLSDIGCLLVVR